ncbi:GL17950 [Drosophila persimilis]|uniref:GL17950 n=1 Tax=Drosophila persimilis TaxID=7234 RepID=B4H1U6_DROPE|nr:GL17950 [Drosophila persimilis]
MKFFILATFGMLLSLAAGDVSHLPLEILEEHQKEHQGYGYDYHKPVLHFVVVTTTTEPPTPPPTYLPPKPVPKYLPPPPPTTTTTTTTTHDTGTHT